MEREAERIIVEGVEIYKRMKRSGSAKRHPEAFANYERLLAKKIEREGLWEKYRGTFEKGGEEK